MTIKSKSSMGNTKIVLSSALVSVLNRLETHTKNSNFKAL